MKYQNKILSVLKEAQGEQLSSRVQKSADDIKTMYQSTLQNMKSLPGIGDDDAEDLTTAAISSAVKTEGETIAEVGNKEVHTAREQKEVKTREDGEAGSEDYEEFQDAINKSMDEHPPAGIVGKIKKEELERVMESLKPKKKIIKVKELKKSK